MDSGGYNPSNAFIAPDLKRRQLLFDSFVKLQQKSSTDSTTSASTGVVTGTGQSTAGSASRAVTSVSKSDSGANASTDANTDATSDSLLVVDGSKGTLLYGWGAGYHGQLGLNTARKKCRLQPSCIDFHEPSLMVACGGFHTAVLTDDGRVYTWGDGRLGQLGNLARKHNMHSTPRLVDYLVTYKVQISYIACGQYHTAALSNQGRLYTWGSGKWGQLGHGVRQDERFPRKVETEKSLGNLVRVACGDRHTAALNDSGAVITFGNGQHGQLGHGNGLDCLKPTVISTGELATHRVVGLDCGATTTAAVTETGQLYLWGFGESLHPKGVSNVLESPREVKVKAPVRQVACGLGHVLVLTQAGDVYSFGVAGMGQIGHGTKNSVRTPRLILKGKEVHQIAAGRYHSMAVSNYGIIYSWGCSESGQTGVNLNLENEYLPRIIETLLTNVVGHIACGEHHSLALTSIAHSTVSVDVQQWKLIEDSELELKKSWLKENPNGLKTKHILAIEESRPSMIATLADTIKKEKEEKAKHAKDKMSLITDTQTLLNKTNAKISGTAGGNAREDEDDNNDANLFNTVDDGERDTVNDINGGLSASAIRHIEATALRLAETGLVFEHKESINSYTHTGNDNGNDSDEEETAQRRRRQRRLNAMINNGGERASLSASQSAAASAQPSPRGTTAATTVVEYTGNDSMEEKESMLVAYQSQTEDSRPSSTNTTRTVKFPPVHRPSSSGTNANSGSVMAMNNAPSENSSEIGFAPLAPRIAFIEATTKTLTRVKAFMSNTVIPAEGNYVDDLIKVKKQYNSLKSERLRLEKQCKMKQHELSLCQPNHEEITSAAVQNDSLKSLNMKLVTLNTRLMEAEENKKNYELYIIRMKEEDLQLGKQIDHLRSICAEYTRLLNKLEKMNRRVKVQRIEVVDETHHLVSDVQSFIAFADGVVKDYRRVLQASYRQSCYQEQLLHQRQERQDAKRLAKIDSLTQDYQSLQAIQNTVKAEINEWEEKVEYYEKRFRKVAAATGLTKPEEIISKFYFNDEITKDLNSEIQSKQATLLELKDVKAKLQSELTASQQQLSISKWKDVSEAEEMLAETKLQHSRALEENDRWTHRLTQTIEGIKQLHSKIRQVTGTPEVELHAEAEDGASYEDEAETLPTETADEPEAEPTADNAEESNDATETGEAENEETDGTGEIDAAALALPSAAADDNESDSDDNDSDDGTSVLDVTRLMNEVAIATARKIATLSKPSININDTGNLKYSSNNSTQELIGKQRKRVYKDPLIRATGLTLSSIKMLENALVSDLVSLIQAVENGKVEANHRANARVKYEQQMLAQQNEQQREEALAAMLLNPRKNIWDSLHEHVEKATMDSDELDRMNDKIEPKLAGVQSMAEGDEQSDDVANEMAATA